MRFAAGEITDDGALRIGAVIEPDIALRTHPGLPAIGADQQLGAQMFAVIQLQAHLIRIVLHCDCCGVDDLQIRCEFECGIERLIQITVFDDPGQARRLVRRISIEGQYAGIIFCVAGDDHADPPPSRDRHRARPRLSVKSVNHMQLD